MVGTHEYPELGREHRVVTVPKIWINNRTHIDGAAPDAAMMERAMVLAIKQALDPSVPPGKLRMVPRKQEGQ